MLPNRSRILDPEPDVGLFWQGRMDGGVPEAVLFTSLDLVRAYQSYLTLPDGLIDDNGWCEGLQDFTISNIERRPAASIRLDGESGFRSLGPCLNASGMIQVANPSARSPGGIVPVSYPCYYVSTYGVSDRAPLCFETLDEVGALRDDPVLPWDAGQIKLLEYDGYYWFQNVEFGTSPDRPFPLGDGVDARAGADRSLRSIYLQPGILHFDAFTVDCTMFMAQLCLDYAFALLTGAFVPSEPERLATAGLYQAAAAASNIAAFALGVVARRSEVLVHEFGHVYLGGSPHSGINEVPGRHWNACFDIVANYWRANVIRHNGLPHGAYVASNLESLRDAGRSLELFSEDGPLDFSYTRETYHTERTLWVLVRDFTESAWCSAVVEGYENRDMNAGAGRWRQLEAGLDLSLTGACAGLIRVDLDAPGVPNSAMRFGTTNGCSCWRRPTENRSAPSDGTDKYVVSVNDCAVGISALASGFRELRIE
jgi:hypothetical protein